MGYIGASLAGWGAGLMIERHGNYEFTFVFFGAAAIVGALLVCLIWKAGPKTHAVD
jgi:sugar phosphate permease